MDMVSANKFTAQIHNVSSYTFGAASIASLAVGVYQTNKKTESPEWFLPFKSSIYKSKRQRNLSNFIIFGLVSIIEQELAKLFNQYTKIPAYDKNNK